MYPTTLTELAAFIAAATPLIIAAFAGLRATRTRAEEANAARWRRMSELAHLLYDHNGGSGAWTQMAAVMELAEAEGDQRRAAEAILLAARLHHKSDPYLSPTFEIAVERYVKKNASLFRLRNLIG